jgi:hypothetical protein
MSTLKTNNFEHLDASSPNITLGIGGGVNISGIATAESGLNVTSGRVGIGTSIPTSILHLKSNTTAEVKLTLQNTNGTTAIYGNNDDIIMDADKYRIRDVNGSAEYIRIVSGGGVGINTNLVASGVNVAVAGTIRVQGSTDATQYLTINHQGIDFQNTGAGSSSTAASHLLDDYEEGTFTPVLSNDGSTTYTTQVGRYTKVGNIVHINALVRINNVSGGSGVTGFTLPFQNDSGTHAVGLLVGNNSWTSNFSDANLAGWMADGSNEMRFYYNSGQNLEAIAVSNIGDGSEAAIQATYRTND